MYHPKSDADYLCLPKADYDWRRTGVEPTEKTLTIGIERLLANHNILKLKF